MHMMDSDWIAARLIRPNADTLERHSDQVGVDGAEEDHSVRHPTGQFQDLRPTPCDVSGDGGAQVDPPVAFRQEADITRAIPLGVLRGLACQEGADDPDMVLKSTQPGSWHAQSAARGVPRADAEHRPVGCELVDGGDGVGCRGGDSRGGISHSDAEANGGRALGAQCEADVGIRKQHLRVVQPGVTEAKSFCCGDIVSRCRRGREGDAGLHDVLEIYNNCQNKSRGLSRWREALRLPLPRLMKEPSWQSPHSSTCACAPSSSRPPEGYSTAS